MSIKESFIKGGAALKRARPTMTVGSDVSGALPKILAFGSDGSGKTSFIRGLLVNGYKVILLSTDMGGSGLNSVRLDMRREGNAHLLENLRELCLDTFEDVAEFLESPESFAGDIWDWDEGKTFLFWDGASFWQNMMVLSYAGENSVAKDTKEAQDEGYQMDQQNWGTVRNVTIRQIAQALAMRNKKTGKELGKIITCALKIEAKGGQNKEIAMPFMSGAGGALMKHGFDLIVHTRVRTETDADADDGKKRIYEYVTEGSGTLIAKKRGFVFDSPVLVAEPVSFLADVIAQYKGEK